MRSHTIVALVVAAGLFAGMVGVFWFAFSKWEKAEQKRRDLEENDVLEHKNRDYFIILEISYQRHAMLKMSTEWGRSYLKVFTDVDAFNSAREVQNHANLEAENLENAQVRERQEFARRYGVSPKDFTEVFQKQFPERDLIFDEIEVVIRPIIRKQENDAASHFVNKSKEENFGLGEAWHRYRRDYLREHAPHYVIQVKESVSKLQSINELSGKIFRKK